MRISSSRSAHNNFSRTAARTSRDSIQFKWITWRGRGDRERAHCHCGRGTGRSRRRSRLAVAKRWQAAHSIAFNRLLLFGRIKTLQVVNTRARTHCGCRRSVRSPVCSGQRQCSCAFGAPKAQVRFVQNITPLWIKCALTPHNTLSHCALGSIL